MKPPRLLALAVFLLVAGVVRSAWAGPGELDPSYTPMIIGNAVYAMGVQADGKLVVGGSFSSVDGSESRGGLARLYSDGTLDSTFLGTGNGVSGTVWSLAVENNGSIIIGGSFSYINGTYRYNVARLNANGTVDGSFAPTNAINSTVMAVAVQTNGAIIIGGTFYNQNLPSYNARLNPDGTTDTTFDPIINGPVYAVALQPNGQILIGGAFTQVNGANRYHIARLNGDGSLDNSFQNGLTGASSNVRTIQVQSDGRILIGGDFTVVNGFSRNFVARLTSTGALDTGFAALGGANGSVYAIAIQANGSVLIGGAFTSYYPNAGLSHVARLYDDGTRDTTFTNSGINNTVESLALQSDGGILIGGLFTTVDYTNFDYLARLYGDLYPPEFVTEPGNVNTNVGANVTFSAQVSNPTTTSFQWEKDGADIPGATDMSYRLYNVQLADAGTYSVFVTDGIGGTSSSNAILQVGVPPAITSQPVSLVVAQGQPANFSISATGMPLNYAWYDNGVFVTGQTNAALAFLAVDPTNAGTYTCKVSNYLSAITSTGAVLTVIYSPVISAQPLGQVVDVGSNFVVSVTANGFPAISYQWRTNGGAIPGATATNYTVVGAQVGNSGAYDVLIANSFGSVTSMVAQVSVGWPPAVSQQPLSLTNAVGGTTGFSCLVTGSVPINLQWIFNGSALAGATNASLTLTNLQPGSIGDYALTATNGFGGTVSSNAALNLTGYPFAIWNGLLAYYPFNGNANDASGNGNNGMVSNVLPVTDRFGNSASAFFFNGSNSLISCNISNIPTGSAPRTISLWGEAIAQASGQLLAGWGLDQPNQGFGILNTSSPADWWGTLGGGGYDLDSGLAVDTNWHQIVLVYDTTNLSITVDGLLAATAAGSLNTAFSPLYIGTALPGGSGYFSGNLDDVRVYNLALSSNAVAALYVLESDLPVITIQPQPQTNNLGGAVNFSVAATAVHPLFYQWQLNGAFILGATNALLTLTNIQPASFGDYSVTVSNGFTGVLSSSATLSGLTPALTLAAIPGQSVSLSVTGLPGTSYVLQSATNLTPPVTWQSVLTNLTDTNGVLQISDTNFNYPQKFYRVTTP